MTIRTKQDRCTIFISTGPFMQLFYLFIFVCAGSLLLNRLLSGCGEQGLLSIGSVWAPHCGGFSCCRAQALDHTGFSSRGTWTQ